MSLLPNQFIYVDDAARALIAVAGKVSCQGKWYTVGSIEPIIVRRFAGMIYRTAGTQGGAGDAAVVATTGRAGQRRSRLEQSRKGAKRG